MKSKRVAIERLAELMPNVLVEMRGRPALNVPSYVETDNAERTDEDNS